MLTRTPESDAERRAEILTQVARAEGLQHKFGEAHATLDAARALLDELPTTAYARFLLERGRVFNDQGSTQEARQCFIKAVKMATAAHEDYYTIDAYHMLGILDPIEKQLTWSLKALAIAEASGESRAKDWVGALLNNIGWTYHDRDHYREALEYFRRALTWREDKGQARETRVARYAVGRALRSLGRIDEALSLQQALLEAWTASGERDGYVFEEIAECLLALDRASDARPYFALAVEELAKDPWFAENEAERLDRLRKLAAGE